VQPLGAMRVVMVLEFIERRIERTEGVTQVAVIAFGRRPGRICADRVRTLVVRDRYRAARRVICALSVRKSDRTHTQAGEQQERDTSTMEPRRTAEHQFELSDSGCTASSIGNIDE
jgi:hypothetical protein